MNGKTPTFSLTVNILHVVKFMRNNSGHNKTQRKAGGEKEMWWERDVWR